MLVEDDVSDSVGEGGAMDCSRAIMCEGRRKERIQSPAPDPKVEVAADGSALGDFKTIVGSEVRCDTDLKFV